MARDGYRIFDSDTHVGPDARILAGYLSEAEKDGLRGWEAHIARPPFRVGPASRGTSERLPFTIPLVYLDES
jgi:hypothetical protein